MYATRSFLLKTQFYHRVEPIELKLKRSLSLCTELKIHSQCTRMPNTVSHPWRGRGMRIDYCAVTDVHEGVLYVQSHYSLREKLVYFPVSLLTSFTSLDSFYFEMCSSFKLYVNKSKALSFQALNLVIYRSFIKFVVQRDGSLAYPESSHVGQRTIICKWQKKSICKKVRMFCINVCMLNSK